MTDKDRQHYIRQLNAGKLPWEVDGVSRQDAEHPMFMDKKSECLPPNTGARVQPLPKNFAPESVYVEFLKLHHGIPEEFILKQLPEFKLYWLETGEARKAWQSKFKNHVIYQWKRKQSETGERTQRSTIEKLTDRSWAEGLELGGEEEY
ncbi:MAG: DnaT-like ssDNA-binding domain-containing protein [Endozoicomonas sp. (ex Botrylloides leachii)]|nr:DnaT-like ssDNA-binding domain-containing protein [Endozoicomonas sp. (ex Botrylloides leachii)]